MKSKTFWLILTISIWWPVTGQSQLHLDYFDEDVLRLARLVWDDSIDEKTEEIMRNHKSLQMPDRGITKEESKRITHELIDPYLEKN